MSDVADSWKFQPPLNPATRPDRKNIPSYLKPSCTSFTVKQLLVLMAIELPLILWRNLFQMTLAPNVLFLDLKSSCSRAVFLSPNSNKSLRKKTLMPTRKKKPLRLLGLNFHKRSWSVCLVVARQMLTWRGNSIKLTRSHLKGLAKLMCSGAVTRLRYIEVLSFPHEIFYYNSGEKNTG